MSNELLDGALALAGRGWPVFPLAPGGKVPLIAGGHGHKDATTDPQQIRAWWGQHPDANVGVSCGGARILVVDVDPRNGGDESLRGLVDAHGDGWLDTISTSTPSGGKHYLFTVPDGLDLRPSGGTSALGRGIDIKVGESYITVPPSRRNDGEYTWEPGRSPFEREPAPVPGWLVDAIVDTRMARPSSAAPVGEGQPIPEGQRNATLTSIAGSMRRRGLTESEIQATLREVNQRCVPPLSEREVAGIAGSVGRYPVVFLGGGLQQVGANSHFSLVSHAEREWPEPPGLLAFHGFAGDLVAAIEPHTEADPIALLANLLVAFGNAVGPGPHVRVGASVHTPREFVALVGRTGKARKGESWNPIRALFERAVPEWVAVRVVNGLSSGEGLIHHVRDATVKSEPVKEKGRVVDYQDVVIDEGVTDKRLMVMEPECARVLRMAERSGNTLSATMRQAWDGGPLQVLTRSNPLRASEAHISIVAHITVEELQKELSDVEAANGFANRFIWLSVKRARLLPDPEPFEGVEVQRFAAQLGLRLEGARPLGELCRDRTANDLWHDVYADLSDEQPGLRGALLARAEAHVLRLSLLYALLDGSPMICEAHLAAAIELWAYAERSVEFIFGDATGNPVADAIHRALRASGEMSRTDISALFGRHESSHRIEQALQQLQASGRAKVATVPTNGRSVEVWRPVA